MAGWQELGEAPGSPGRNWHLGLGPQASRAVGRAVGALLGQPPHRPMD